MPDEFKRAEQKHIAVLRAQQRLKQRLENIDFEHEVVIPTRERIRANAAAGLITDATLVEIEDGSSDE